MSLITVLILIAALVVFAFLVSWQRTNWKNSRDALEEVDRIVELKKFDLHIITASDVIINQFDRMVELPLEKIRSFSNGALVAGIGGTMGLFLLEASSIGSSLIFQGMEMPPLWTVFLVLGLALLSSLMGVIYHLRITSRILSAAHDKVSKKETEFLEAQVQDQIPETRLSERLKELTEAWNEAEAGDLFQMIPQFLQGQTSVMQEMEVRFEKQLKTTQEVLQGQKDFTQKIDEVLAESNNHSRAQQESVAKIQETHQNLLGAVSDSLEKLIGERKSLTAEIESLPENIRNSIDVDRIEEIFGRQAQNYVLRLGDAFQKEIFQLKESLEKNQINQSRALAEENRKMVKFFNDFQIEIRERIVNPLREVAVQLDETTDIMPKAAQQFGDELRESAQVLSGIPKKLEEAGTSINEVVGSTTLEALTPLSDKMIRYIETVQHTHENLEKIIQNLVHLIRNMVKEMEGKK